MTSHHPSRRLWTPIGIYSGTTEFANEDVDWFRLVVAPDTKRLDELGNCSCLFLLGEPGMGKSTTVRAEIARLRTTLPEDQTLLDIDLAAVSSDPGLDAIFADPVVSAWRDGQGVLHLFLDSYDECLRHYSTLKARLLLHLRQQPLDRLRLRIVCRSGDFPGHLPDDLRDFWSPTLPELTADIRIVVLQPLSRSAVRSWAEAEGLDGEAFLSEVGRRNGRSFAARPITLRPLIELYRRGQFPTSEVDLFDASCQSLCRETNPDRTHEAELSEEQRFAIAERIAVLTTLAGKDRVWLGEPALVPDGALKVADLMGDQEHVRGTVVDVDRGAVNEVLSCALFAVHDGQLIRWSQQVYREFLAARFFARRLERPVNALQFFEHQGRPDSTERRIAPQLAESAAWLAAMDEEVAAWLVLHDPGVVLRGNHDVPETVRCDLIGWWLKDASLDRDLDAPWSPTQLRDHLSYDGLADQLKRILVDREAATAARSLACDLAFAAYVPDLSESIVMIAESDQEPLDLRWRAARAVSEIGDEATRARLRHVLDDVDGDSGAVHRLRAYVLAAVWPHALSTSEALEYLATRDGDAGDEYTTAFEGRFLRDITSDQLVEALNWIAARADRPDGRIESLIAQLAEVAAHRIDQKPVCDALAHTLTERIRVNAYFVGRREREIVASLRERSVDDRLHLADTMAAQFGVTDDPFELDRWIVDLDLPYETVLDRAVQSRGTVARLWTSTLRMDPRTWNEESLPLLRAAIAEAGPQTDARSQLVALADQVEAGKEAVRAEADAEAPEQPVPFLGTRRRTVESNVQAAMVNLLPAWDALCRNLNLDEKTNTWILEYDLSETPGWEESTAEIRSEIVAVAHRFLSTVPTESPHLRQHNRVASNGFMAALLLADVSPTVLDTLSESEWGFWIPALLTTGAGMADANRGQHLSCIAYARYPEGMLTELRAFLRTDDAANIADRVFQGLGGCWNEALQDVLVSVLDDDHTPLAVRRAVLASLLQRGESRASECALSWVRTAADDRPRAIAAGWTLLKEGQPEAIDRLMTMLAGDRELAQDILLAAAPLARRSSSAQQWPVSLVESVYRLAVEIFPPSDDPDIRPGRFNEIGDRMDAAEWRDGLLWRLASHGTWEVVNALEHLANERPDLRKPGEVWHEAYRQVLAQTWEPWPDPTRVLDFIADNQKRVIRNTDQLLDLIKESLARLQHNLVQGGAAPDLWSEGPDKRQRTYRPKAEVSISDYIKRFLDRDLERYTIAVDREVENRQGNETDILVTYIDRDDRGREIRRVLVVIEVKGCWHDDVLTAMQDQLANRYLIDYETDRGLYLVVWFQCDLWDVRDPNRRKPTDYSLESLREELDGQARQLTTEQRRIEAVVLDAALR